MRILLSLTYYLPHISGITVYNHRLAKALVEDGHRVTVVTSRYDRALPVSEVMDGVQVVRLPVWFWISKGAIMPGFPWRFQLLLREHDAVVMNLPNTPVEALFGPVLARLQGIPLLAKHMCDIELPPSPFNQIVNVVTRWMNLLAVGLSDGAITMTRDYARHSPVLRRFFHKLSAIPPPVDMRPAPDEVVSRWKEKHGVEGGPLIGFAARLATEKGVEVLLRALPRLVEIHPRVKVLFAGERRNVIGEAAYRERLEPLLARSTGHWQFLGLVSQEDLPAFYTACDLTVLPSLNRTESFGIVQVESMLCGTPVVASNLPGVRHAIRQTGMGRIVPIGDDAALARAILAVLEDPAAYTRTHDQISGFYSTNRTRRLYEDHLEEGIDRRQTAWTHLKAKPVFLALQRAVEHRVLSRAAMPMERPILDLGTGDGHFAGAVLGAGVDFGVDCDAGAVARARRCRVGGKRVYQRVLRADRSRIPLPSGRMATVLSNSTLEHIEDLDATLREVARVLRPGGHLVATVPTDRWNRSLFTGRVLRKLGLARLAHRYEEWFRRIQRHHHLLTPEEWTRRIEAAGLEVVDSRGYFPPSAVAALEVLHYEGWHNLLSRALTGRWVFFPWRPLYALPEWFITRFLREPFTDEGCCLYIKARKPVA